MRSVLVVTAHFPPVNAADHHRIRMALNYLKEFGWKAHILTVNPNRLQNPTLEPLLEKTYPEDTSVSLVNAFPFGLTRLFGLGSLAIRSYYWFDKIGSELLKQQKFDLVFFTTTQFNLFMLGVKWKHRFNVPFVVDYQDPWTSDYYETTNTPPPGGNFKYKFTQWLAKKQEPKVLKDASHIISVSPAYPKMLMTKYSFLNSNHFTVLPFAAPNYDLSVVNSAHVMNTQYNNKSGRHWVYIGRAGDDMKFSVSALFAAIKAERLSNSSLFENLTLHFIGTSYDQGNKARKTVAPIAEQYGIEDLVKETTHRIPYFETLKCLKDADLVLAIGSDDPSYTASKIYPYLMLERPILAIFHQQSSVHSVLTTAGIDTVAGFSETTPLALQTLIVDIRQQMVRLLQSNYSNSLKLTIESFSARPMTETLCRVFDSAAT
ncbi:MAG: hypothetical protein OEZ58_14855 [Gammaproteobacteria bacterium]|nr:hypothetical protein [Gammaproteobacteria bacterium]MDH5730274.1 hypothetical protein [Gammaproteobacteria bacterium]